ncbi:M23 family metallopeptidase [Maribacter sp. 2304DJ31-5]|uniref:M23 family metallopeptidase n=1 Tax=Maribacter sp. 2304DJ31-5 TaxID=3386273 RepID=UPI0039BC3032
MNAFFYSYPDDNYGINDGSPTGEDGDGEWEVPPNTDPDEKDWYLDNDGDGYHSAHIRTVELPSAYSGGNWDRLTHGPDCDDGNPEITTECNNEKPCVSDDGKKANPLNTIQVLGTINSGIPGGLYGNGRGRFHDGVDLEASVGTPIYSIYGGTVDFSITSHTEGEDWDERGTWTGDRNGAGNRIYISSTVDSDNYQFGYWHLSEVETNPNTGEPYKAGDTIAQGDLIGYVGTTGNANSDDSAGPHLHLRGRKWTKI